MNWQKGLFRLWAIMTVIWLLLAGAAGIALWQSDAEARAAAAQWAKHDADCALPKLGPWCDYPIGVTRSSPVPAIAYFVAIGTPPVLIFILGLAGLWIASGFRKSAKP